MNATINSAFEPSPGLLRAAESLLVAMTAERLVRPVVEAYEHAILAKHQFPPAEEYRQHVKEEVILDRTNAWLLGEADFKVYNAECFAARDAAGLKVSQPDNCPLLEAENAQRLAVNALIQEVGNIPGLETFKKDNGAMTLEMRKQIVDITLGLVAPYFDHGNGVLKRYLNG